MILKTTQQDSDANNPNDYFNALRQKNYDASFDGVKNFIVENKNKLRHPQTRRPLHKWQWVLAVILPVLVVLACTKTEHTEAVGHTILFSVPQHDDVIKQKVENLVGRLQTVVTTDSQKQGYLSYTCFLTGQSTHSVNAVITSLKGVNGVIGLSTMPVNTRVKESLLSQLGYKIFSTHIDATAMSDEEMQNTVMKQLKDKGFNNISVAVFRNEKGVRTIQLHPAENAPNYIIDMSIDDKGTKMVLQEEKRTSTNQPTRANEPKMDFKGMTDAQVRDYIRSIHGKDLHDGDIKITRTSEEIAIEIKQTDEKEEIMRFRLN